MRASLDSSVGAERAVPLRKDHRFSGWFWDHEFGFCQRHLVRDRQRRIEGYLRLEEQPRTGVDRTAPVAEQTVLTS